MLLSMMMAIVIIMLVLIPYRFQTLLSLKLTAKPQMLEDEIKSKDSHLEAILLGKRFKGAVGGGSSSVEEF